MHRRLLSVMGVLLVSGFIAAPDAAAQQSVNFLIGGFTPRAIDARPDDDVLVQNGIFLSTLDRTRGIDIGEFNHVTVGGEWLFALTPYVEGGLGIGFYQRSVPTLYTDLVNKNGTDIEQTLKLRIIPFTATVRFLPLGNHQAVQPYIGAGVGVYRWRYSETGQFVDSQNNVFTGNFVGSGGASGPTILGGVRVPIGSAVGVGFEIRHQSAEGKLPADQGFAGTTIDLGGYSYLFTTSFRF
jgi:Outer membrane protein beta-barrel domain